jgi:ParB-like chromosome segregation protein Spo0J
MQTVLLPTSKLKPNPNNPRVIKNGRFKKLVQSIEELPSMLKLRPIVVDSNYIILGGNMRFKACIEAGLKEVPVIIADELTSEEQKAFVIKDNASFGEWDYDSLSNEWDSVELEEWGLDVWQNEDDLINAIETEEPKHKTNSTVCALCGKNVTNETR